MLKMFKVVKSSTRKKLQNLKVHNNDEKCVTNPQEILKLTIAFVEKKFKDPKSLKVDFFKGKLDHWIILSL